MSKSIATRRAAAVSTAPNHPASHLVKLPKLKVKGSLSPVWRRVDHECTVDGVVYTHCKSFTQRDTPEKDADQYEQHVCTRSGEIKCACKNFIYVRVKAGAHLSNEASWCKHLRRTIAGAVRRGEAVYLKDKDGNITGAVGAASAGEAPFDVDRYDADHDEYADEYAHRVEQEQKDAEEEPVYPINGDDLWDGAQRFLA